MVELSIKGKGKQVNVVQGNKESTWSAGGDVKERGSASFSLDSKSKRHFWLARREIKIAQ